MLKIDLIMLFIAALLCISNYLISMRSKNADNLVKQVIMANPKYKHLFADPNTSIEVNWKKENAKVVSYSGEVTIQFSEIC